MSEQAQTTEPPAILYKYLPPERIDVLESQELRFSPPSKFNDTFDSHFLVPRLTKAMMNRATFRSKLGILCLTERPNDHLMWVHYAGEHKGFVIGFDAADPFFTSDGRALQKVVYQKKPIVMPEIDINVAFNKSDVWEHEREWRCVRQFEQTEARNVRFDPILVKQVIFGAKMEPWQVARIVLFMFAHNPEVQYFASTASSKDGTFQNIPKHLAPCDKCGTSGYVEEDQPQF